MIGDSFVVEFDNSGFDFFLTLKSAIRKRAENICNELLLRKDAKSQIANHENEILELAAFRGMSRVVDRIVRLSPEVKQKIRRNNHTALKSALNGGNPDVAIYIIEQCYGETEKFNQVKSVEQCLDCYENVIANNLLWTSEKRKSFLEFFKKTLIPGLHSEQIARCDALFCEVSEAKIIAPELEQRLYLWLLETLNSKNYVLALSLVCAVTNGRIQSELSKILDAIFKMKHTGVLLEFLDIAHTMRELALRYIIQEGDLEKLHLIVREYNLRLNVGRNSLLKVALKEHKVNIVEYLLQSQEVLDELDGSSLSDTSTSSMASTSSIVSTSTVAATLNATSVLNAAIDSGRIDLVSLIMTQPAIFRIFSENKNSFIKKAAENGFFDIAKYLVEQGEQIISLFKRSFNRLWISAIEEEIQSDEIETISIIYEIGLEKVLAETAAMVITKALQYDHCLLLRIIHNVYNDNKILLIAYDNRKSSIFGMLLDFPEVGGFVAYNDHELLLKTFSEGQLSYAKQLLEHYSVNQWVIDGNKIIECYNAFEAALQIGKAKKFKSFESEFNSDNLEDNTNRAYSAWRAHFNEIKPKFDELFGALVSVSVNEAIRNELEQRYMQLNATMQASNRVLLMDEDPFYHPAILIDRVYAPAIIHPNDQSELLSRYKELIDKRARKDAYDVAQILTWESIENDGFNVIKMAAEIGAISLISYFLRIEAVRNNQELGSILFGIACSGGHTDCVALISDKFTIVHEFYQGATLLACSERYLGLLVYLLSKTIWIDGIELKLLLLAAKPLNLNLVQLLLEYPKIASKVASKDNIVIRSAIENQCDDIVDELLKYDQVQNILDAVDNDALYKAVEKRESKIAVELLKYPNVVASLMVSNHRILKCAFKHKMVNVLERLVQLYKENEYWKFLEPRDWESVCVELEKLKEALKEKEASAAGEDDYYIADGVAATSYLPRYESPKPQCPVNYLKILEALKEAVKFNQHDDVDRLFAVLEIKQSLHDENHYLLKWTFVSQYFDVSLKILNVYKEFNYRYVGLDQFENLYNLFRESIKLDPQSNKYRSPAQYHSESVAISDDTKNDDMELVEAEVAKMTLSDNKSNIIQSIEEHFRTMARWFRKDIVEQKKKVDEALLSLINELYPPARGSFYDSLTMVLTPVGKIKSGLNSNASSSSSSRTSSSFDSSSPSIERTVSPFVFYVPPPIPVRTDTPTPIKKTRLS